MKYLPDLLAASAQGEYVCVGPVEALQLEDPAQGVAPHSFPLVGAENPTSKCVQQMDRHNPTVDVDNRLETVVR